MIWMMCSDAWGQQFKQVVCRVRKVCYNVLSSGEVEGVSIVLQGGTRAANYSLFCADPSLEGLSLCCWAVGIPHCDVVCQGAFYDGVVKGQQQLLDTLFFQTIFRMCRWYWAVLLADQDRHSDKWSPVTESYAACPHSLNYRSVDGFGAELCHLQILWLHLFVALQYSVQWVLDNRGGIRDEHIRW